MNPCHDHQHCIDTALNNAREICAQLGQRFTPLRKQVLELIWQSHHPVGAYELIDLLAAASARRIAPPTIYRTLEFLLEAGLIHRIHALNAYIGCGSPNLKHPSYFLICTQCNSACELDSHDIELTVDKISQQAGFHIKQQSLEVLGVCQNCQ